MASRHLRATISEDSVAEVERGFASSREHGADLRFHGVVRELEDGHPIAGIHYSCYQAMAELELGRVLDSFTGPHPDCLIEVHHRIGFVPAGEASIVIRVRARHSAEAYEVSRECLHRIKTSVPIWKEPRPLEADPAAKKPPTPTPDRPPSSP